jgi:hypothetical protein
LLFALGPVLATLAAGGTPRAERLRA